MQHKGFETIEALNKKIDNASNEKTKIEKKLEVLQSRHDDSNSISAAEKGEIAKAEKDLDDKEKIEKDLRDTKSAYETRIMKRDKDIIELKLAAGDRLTVLRSEILGVILKNESETKYKRILKRIIYKIKYD